MPKIILSTLNARYIHSALGLRYLLANMGELENSTAIREFTLETRPADLAERLLAETPEIIGFGVYIWNIEETTRLVALLKALAPEVTIVLGGPEVSHECGQQPIVAMADHVITGQADLAFAALCRGLLAGDTPSEKIIRPTLPDLKSLHLPYRTYTDEDIANRVIYVEASRGCPFKCEFCLSALDKTSWPFHLPDFLQEMALLHERGVRHFKFVDRTFNLDLKSSIAILEFFLDRLDEELFLHFEVIPDRLPAKLKSVLQRFPKGTLQLEVGVQSFNPEVQTLISRKQDNEKSCENLHWLREESNAHLHTDLIIGLPGEDMQSFGRGFDRLCALKPHEIQVGILKRLRGAPVNRHTDAYCLRFNPNPPYDILSSDRIDFPTMQRLTRFARYWDMIANSGRFSTSLNLILGPKPFDRFLQLSDWLFERTGQVHRIALKRLFDLLHEGMLQVLGIEQKTAVEALASDYHRASLKGLPAFLRTTDVENRGEQGTDPVGNRPARQARHSH
ncbi:MAG: DUF4080 domain-containing protein [Sedimenticola sp.]